MRLPLDKKILLAFALAVAIMLAAAVAALVSIRGLAVQTRRVERTYQVLGQVGSTISLLRTAQSGVRGYLLTGDTTFLQPYHQALTGLPPALARVRALAAEGGANPGQLDSLSLLMEQEFSILRPLARPRLARDRAAVQTSLDTDRQTMHALRGLYGRIQATEAARLRQGNQRQELYERSSPVFVLGSAGLALVLVGWLIGRMVRELRSNRRLQAELRQSGEDTARRIELIENLAQRVVRGDYSVKIDLAEAGPGRLRSLATSLNQMTQALEQAFSALEKRNQELNQFAYVASHDLKAPLRNLASIVKWMEDEHGPELSPGLRAYVGQLKGRVARLEELINGLLAYARAGRTQREAVPVAVAALLREVAELVVPAGFQLTLAPDLPTLAATDRLSLAQVFTNLLSNAVKHYGPDPTGGRAHVSARDLGARYEFRVQDNGPGIAPEHQQKIFLLFQTLRERHAAESTGLGLSIVEKIVHEQGGTVYVESAPGLGATFVFTWPK